MKPTIANAPPVITMLGSVLQNAHIVPLVLFLVVRVEILSQICFVNFAMRVLFMKSILNFPFRLKLLRDHVVIRYIYK
jgi:hypothetical protein